MQRRVSGLNRMCLCIPPRVGFLYSEEDPSKSLVLGSLIGAGRDFSYCEVSMPKVLKRLLFIMPPRLLLPLSKPREMLLRFMSPHPRL